jgi:hypothetical protein
LNIDGKLNCTSTYQSGLFYTVAKFTDPGGAFAADITNWSTNVKSTGTAVAGYATYLGVIGTTSAYRGVQGTTTGGTSTYAVYGDGGSGIGVGATSGHIAVEATATGTGTAIYVNGPMTITNTTVVANLNADMVDGRHVGTGSNQIPINNDTVNPGLVAGYLGFGTNKYYLSGTNATGTATATTSYTTKPGANSTNEWLKLTINSSDYYIAIWPA